jgi:hypothetical protein
MMKTKTWWSSKTIWVNVMAGVAAIAAGFGLDLGLTAEVQSQVVVGVLAAVNVALRVVTSSALSLD